MNGHTSHCRRAWAVIILHVPIARDHAGIVFIGDRIENRLIGLTRRKSFPVCLFDELQLSGANGAIEGYDFGH